jgi:hypothetical protein
VGAAVRKVKDGQRGRVSLTAHPLVTALQTKIPSLLDSTKDAILVVIAIGPDASHASAALFVKHLTVAAS